MTLIHLIQLMQRLARDHRKKIFTLRDIASLTDSKETRASIAMTLLRAARKGLLARTGNLWINLMETPDLFEVALALVSPSYLSFESALYRRGILSQAPRGAFLMATTGRSRLVFTPLGTIRYIHLKAPLFFGFDEQRIAYPEKAWLDLLYIRGRAPGHSEVTETLYLENLNRRRLKEFAKRFPESVSNAHRNIVASHY